MSMSSLWWLDLPILEDAQSSIVRTSAIAIDRASNCAMSVPWNIEVDATKQRLNRRLHRDLPRHSWALFCMRFVNAVLAGQSWV